MTIDEARAKAHQQYDDCIFCPGCSMLLTGLHKDSIFCPGCSKLLTGLHKDSKCYFDWIEKKAQQILEISKNNGHRS